MTASPSSANSPVLPSVLFTDIDGTFLNEDHLLSQANKFAYAELTAAGVTVIPATGRNHASVARILGNVSVDDSKIAATSPLPLITAGLESFKFRPFPGIYIQGAVVYGCGGVDDVVFEKSIEYSIARILSNAVAAYKAESNGDGDCIPDDGCCMYYHKDCIFLERDNQECQDFCAKWGDLKPTTMGPNTADLMEAQGKKIHKFQVFGSARFLTNIHPKLATYAQAFNMRLLRTTDECMECIGNDVSKLEAAMHLCEHLGIPKDRLAAIGDGDNDVEILSGVHHSVAMGNGTKACKSSARFETESNERDGWARAMLRLFPASLSTESQKAIETLFIVSEETETETSPSSTEASES